MDEFEIRRRLEAYLYSPFDTYNITSIFLYLRQRASKYKKIREIGDFIAHSDRDRGLIADELKDTFLHLRYKMTFPSKNPDWYFIIPEEFPKFIEIMLRNIDKKILFNDTGLKVSEAKIIANDLVKKFILMSYGKYAISSNMSEIEHRLFQCLHSYLISKFVYDEIEIFSELRLLLLELKILKNSEIAYFDFQSNKISKYLILFLHGKRIIDGKYFINLHFSTVNDYCGIFGSSFGFDLNGSSINFSFPVLKIHANPEDICSRNLINSNEGRRVITVNEDEKLDLL